MTQNSTGPLPPLADPVCRALAEGITAAQCDQQALELIEAARRLIAYASDYSTVAALLRAA